MLLLFRTASHEMEKLLFIQQDFLDEMQDNQLFWSLPIHQKLKMSVLPFEMQICQDPCWHASHLKATFSLLLKIIATIVLFLMF